MSTYYNFLNYNKKRLEDVLKWFFTEYLQSQYGCPEIRVAFPSEGTTYAEKCHTILTALESVLRQFSLYVKNGKIDFELVAMSSTPIRFGDIGSLVENKYVYGMGLEFNRITVLLFSNQCLLSFIPRLSDKKKQYESLFELLQNEEVFEADYEEYYLHDIRYLRELGLISVLPNGRIILKNMEKIIILKDLYDNDVINQKHYPAEYSLAFMELLNADIITEKSSLFTKPEVDYLNYLLNRAEFDNGLEIRNKYLHGIQQVTIDENEHRQNYIILLQILVLIAIKIDDDFYLKSLEPEVDIRKDQDFKD